MIFSSLLLRRALLADAAASGGLALPLAFASRQLSALLGLPEPLLFEAGLFLIGYAAFVGWLGTRATLPPALVWLVIAGNALWTLGSLALPFAGLAAPGALGLGFLIAQAVAVGIFAELQYLGLRQSHPAQSA